MVFDSFITFTLGIVVLFSGVHLTSRLSFLRRFNIPEPVTGGLIATVGFLVLHTVTQQEIRFDLQMRDYLLVYFFTCIGLNARLGDLWEGGRPLVLLLLFTLGFIVLQNAVGVFSALALGLQGEVGVLAGSASLIGGHGTAIAWSPAIGKSGVESAGEIGAAAATLGLIVASLVGGPIAGFLLRRHDLEGGDAAVSVVGVRYTEEQVESISHLNVMAVLLAVHVALILGYIANSFIGELGLKLPLYVPCLLVAIAMSNTVPGLFPRIRWPARTPALALVSDFSLSLFLAMSLMSMQLWNLAELAGPLLAILGIQTVAASILVILALFPLMGRDYRAVVLCAGFGGFSLGATPVAIANMTAVTKEHGAAPLAFIILPLVSAFFVDVSNSVVIQIALDICAAL